MFKKWLKDNSIEIYLTNNEGKSVFAERFIRTLNNKIYRRMAAVSKNVYTDELDGKWIIVNEYNNTYHTIKMKPVDVKDIAYIFSSKDPKFNDGDHVRISKHKKVFAKGYTPNWSEEVFGIS